MFSWWDKNLMQISHCGHLIVYAATNQTKKATAVSFQGRIGQTMQARGAASKLSKGRIQSSSRRTPKARWCPVRINQDRKSERRPHQSDSLQNTTRNRHPKRCPRNGSNESREMECVMHAVDDASSSPSPGPPGPILARKTVQSRIHAGQSHEGLFIKLIIKSGGLRCAFGGLGAAKCIYIPIRIQQKIRFDMIDAAFGFRHHLCAYNLFCGCSWVFQSVKVLTENQIILNHLFSVT